MTVVTIRCPLALTAAAGHVMHLMGKAATVTSYDTAPIRQDSQGTQFRVSSGIWTQTQIDGVDNPAILSAPHLQEMFSDYDPPGLVDRALCAQAQAAFAWWAPGDPMPADDQIVAVLGLGGQEALTALGLEPVPAEI